MKHLLFIVLSFCCGGLFAQNITVVEYFFDTDPGYGSGTSVAITPAPTLTNLSFNVNVSAQSDGFHTLFVRAKDANNNWSAANSKLFYKLNISAVTPAPNITKIEYFFDTDPGFSSGIDVPITPGVSITNYNFAIPLTSVADGFHTLFVRTRNANNQWSATYSQQFYKFSAAALAPAPNINKIEYFLDTDPGYGAGTNVPITPAVSITDHNFTIPLSSTADGFHTLYVRSRDANNNWGAAYSRPFYKLSSSVLPPIPNINKLEYFIDADPGYGAGINVAVTPGVSIPDLSVPIPVTAITEGNHIITFRARDVNNNWSVVAIKNFSKCNHPGTTVSAATSITSSSFTASWADVPGSISYRLDVSTDNFNTFVSGYNAKVITAPALSSVVTGLSQATTYQYRVRAVASCTSVESNAVSLTTLATPPSAQPTNLLFSSITSTSLTAFFNAPTTAPTGYLVVRKIGSASSFVPNNNTNYSLNYDTGEGVIAYVGTNFLFNEAGLTPDTQYFYSVFAYNQLSTSISYLTTTPLQNNVRTIALEPTAQPTNLQFASVSDVSFTVSFTAATGSPTGYLVLRKVGSAPSSTPVDGTAYTTTVGTDAVVHNSAATNFPQTGLTQNTEYFYTVYAYNGSGTSINYRVVSPLQGSQLTPITPPVSSPTNLVFSNITSSQVTVLYSAAPGSPAGYLVMRRVGSSPTFIPQLNTVYTVGSNFSGNVVAYYGSQLSFTDAGLSASTTYFYDVFAFNQIGSLIGYQTASPLEGSITTFTAEPTAQASGLVFSNPTTNSLTLGFTAASPAPTGYLILRKASSAPTSPPVDGQAYALLSSIGDGTVVYVGSTVPLVDSGLQPGTTYFYQVFSYNGSGAATNYLTTVNASNSGSKITVPGKPAIPTASLVGQNQFTLNWTATTGADNYRLDVSKDNFGTRVNGFDALTVTGLTRLVSGLETGTAYKFRIRAVNNSGTSVNSDEVQQFTIPATPILTAALNIGQTSFTPNWSPVTGATAYFIDVSLNALFTSFVAGYANKPVGSALTTDITNLTAGTTHYYRIRADNSSLGGGTSPSSANGTQLLKPATPFALNVTNRQQTSFIAIWESVTGAAFYEIDVALDASNFSTILFTKDDIPGNETSFLINQLTPNTAYRYRVRARNGAGSSFNSNTIPVSTLEQNTGSPLQIGVPSFTASFTTASTSSVEVSGGTAPYTVRFYFRKITSSGFTSINVSSTNSNYQTAIEDTMLDEIGLEFYFEATDASGSPKRTNSNFIYRGISSVGLKIPFTKFGGTKESYELFSIPYELAKNGTADIFDELGAIDKSKWRLSRYQNGKNVDVGAGLTAIEQGKGYWFNSKEKVDVFFSNGTITKANQSTPFKLTLESGWNQIGNPYPFNVDWDDIVNLSSNKSQVGKLKVFNAEQFTLNDESNNLKTWSGGFVFNSSTQRVELDLPVTLKNTAGGRKATSDQLTADLSNRDWFVPLAITQDGIANHTAGFGMHSEANLSKDFFDDMVVPRFLNYVEFYTTHTDYFYPWFAKDVVPTTNSNKWEFSFESNRKGPVELSWIKEDLGMNAAQLFLFDPIAGVLLDMKKSNRYRFEPRSNQSIRIFYGASEKELSPDVNALNAAWPNPFSGETNISFVVKDKSSKVTLDVYDMLGKKINELVEGVYDSGIYSSQWQGNDARGEQAAAGLYMVRLEINGFISVQRIIKK